MRPLATDERLQSMNEAGRPANLASERGAMHAPLSSSARKLSAELSGKPDPSTTVLFATDRCGRLLRITGQGDLQVLPLPAGWAARQVSVSAAADTVWIVAQGSHGEDAFAVWQGAADGSQWACLVESPIQPLIAGAQRGMWIWANHTLQLQYGGNSEPKAIQVDVDPVDLNEGADGTLWMLGGERRYGGFEVRRFDWRTGDWFLLPPPAAAISIAGAPDGTAWSVSSKGEVWRLNPEGAGSFRECGMNADCRRCFYSPNRSFARKVSVGADGNVWFLSDELDAEGYSIRRMTDLSSRDSEKPAPAARAVSIAAARLGTD